MIVAFILKVKQQQQRPLGLFLLHPPIIPIKTMPVAHYSP